MSGEPWKQIWACHECHFLNRPSAEFQAISTSHKICGRPGCEHLFCWKCGDTGGDAGNSGRSGTTQGGNGRGRSERVDGGWSEKTGGVGKGKIWEG